MFEPFPPIEMTPKPGGAEHNADVITAWLRANFPEAVTEAGIDFDVLRELLGQQIIDPASEKFGLTWPGRAEARRQSQVPAAGTLLPKPEWSEGDWDSTNNVVVEGDNLEVLKLLRRSYAGKVDVIYIDPPYNTGNDFVYKDSFADGRAAYEHFTEQRDDGGKLTTNTEATGRYHANWLSMMAPRLQIAHSLLKDTGVIIVAIDDTEHANLRLLLDQVFGGENFISDVVWQGGRKNDSKYVSNGADYMLIYAKNERMLSELGVRWREPKQSVDVIIAAGKEAWAQAAGDEVEAQRLYKEWWKKLPTDHPAQASKHYNRVEGTTGCPGRVFFPDNLSWPGGGGPSYAVLHPTTGRPVKTPARGWRLQEPRMREEIAKGRIFFGDDETKVPTYKRYLDETDSQVADSVFYKDRRASNKELQSLLGRAIFDFPKDVHVVAKWVDLVSNSKPDAVVLDFFAGSGSTGHAVMNLNAADGGNRQYILVQLDEPVKHDQYETIADITRERLRRAGRKIAEEQGLLVSTNSTDGALDLGFRAYKLASSNIRQWDGVAASDDLEFALQAAADNLLAGRTTDDLVVEMMLKLGLELTTPVEVREIAGSKLYNLGGGALFAFFGESVAVDVAGEVAEAIRRWKADEGTEVETSVVVRDTGFADSAAKLNFVAGLKQARIDETLIRSL